jgi:glycyl-tRNA synthetase beta chain
MKKNNYLLEFGCEEIPARFVAKMVDSLKLGFEKYLKAERLNFDSITVYATYRRLVVIVEDIVDKQEDFVDYVKGPPEKMVYDTQGDYSKASIGFSKKNNVSLEKCELKEFNGKQHLSFRNYQKGIQSQHVLTRIVPEIIMGLPLFIAMRWSTNSTTFIRPIHWIVSLFNDEVVPFSMFNLEAAKTSFGHRFLSKGETSLGKAFTVSLKASILDQYRKMSVILDQQERRDMIVSGLKNYSQINLDEDLLNEIVYLVEMPTLLKGDFDEKYLELPDFVLIECMKKHQRYFPYYTKSKLQASFLVVADNVTKFNQKKIVSGNENVLIARLEDAMFFYKNDINQDLNEFVKKLSGVVFQKNAGTMLDKQSRIFSILQFLNDAKVFDIDDSVLKKIATLSKMDLVSSMVLEFPSLQGKMGAVYARLAGEDPLVYEAIGEHYLPAGKLSEMPTSLTGVVLGVSDRLDTVVESFKLGANPTGSQDPLGLRRAVMGICELILGNKLDINLYECIDFCLKQQKKDVDLTNKIIDFFYLRIKTILIDKGIDYDVVDALRDSAFKNLNATLVFARDLQDYKQVNNVRLKLISETAVRIARLAKKATDKNLDCDLFVENIERELYDDYLKLQKLNLLNFDHYYSFSLTFNKYFDQILVMSDNLNLKMNRLAFLKKCDSFYNKLADFEKLII